MRLHMHLTDEEITFFNMDSGSEDDMTTIPYGNKDNEDTDNMLHCCYNYLYCRATGGVRPCDGWRASGSAVRSLDLSMVRKIS